MKTEKRTEHSFKIKDLTIEGKSCIAPIDGITDTVYRQIVKSYGCSLMYTEMISSDALDRRNKSTLSMCSYEEFERPVGLQIMGNKPDVMIRAGRIGEDLGFDLIDVNMGCPSRKIVKKGAGAWLMRYPELAGEIVSGLAAAVKIPVTVKIRSGWDPDSGNALEIAEISSKAGAAALTIHGRFAVDSYAVEADWDIIRQTVETLDIPVIGNGDVDGPSKALSLLQQTGCAAVMVGRAAIGKPWILRDIENHLTSRPHQPQPHHAELLDIMIKHLDGLVEFRGEQRGVSRFKAFIAYYMKGLPYCSQVKSRLYLIKTKDEFIECLENYFKSLE